MIRRPRMRVPAVIATALAAALLAGCGSSGGGGVKCDPTMPDLTYNPVIDPANFVAVIDNPLFPLIPGAEWTYENEDETDVVTVTNDTKVVQGVTTVVVHDVVSENGEPTEDTLDYYAQDADGNVWYFGEDSKELKNGVVTTTAGSWEAGVDGAKPGIIMYAEALRPAIGVEYRQEYYVCEAEDMASVFAEDVSVTVPTGTYDHCLETSEFTPLEPGVDEHKYYCPGIGTVLEVDQKEKNNPNELIDYTTP